MRHAWTRDREPLRAAGAQAPDERGEGRARLSLAITYEPLELGLERLRRALG